MCQLEQWLSQLDEFDMGSFMLSLDLGETVDEAVAFVESPCKLVDHDEVAEMCHVLI